MLLESYYPWDSGENSSEKAKAIYDFVRNPLSHALGEDKKPGYKISVMKSRFRKGLGKYTGWKSKELQTIEKAEMRPTDLPQALQGSAKIWDFRVESFYWGVFQLLRQLAKDKTQMQEAQKRFSSGKFVWHK